MPGEWRGRVKQQFWRRDAKRRWSRSGDDGVGTHVTSRRGAAGRAACSHEQTHAQPAAIVRAANKALGAARSESKLDMEDAVTAMT